ncbi:MAG TPA: DUF5916 domain-containing protein [Opitutaceae bacterium]|nr:DUF5916 domain-containing protein [Opitutaceae bacterium]
MPAPCRNRRFAVAPEPVAALRPRRATLLLVRLVAGLVLASGPGRAVDGPQDRPAPAPAHLLPKRVYHAARLQGPPPKIDGRLDDPCWSEGEWTGDFTQREPHEGKPGSQPTQLKILYDHKYLYVALRAYDSDLATLPRLRGRRDEFVGDIIGINFDSYFDKRTGFEFDLTAGGSKIDLLLRNDGWDTDWNAVWDGKVGTEAGAWTAEFRIPFNQLRYGRQPEQVWGLHSWRWINRRQEESDWQLLPMDSPGFVYSFGELRGIRDLPASRRIEVLPYALVKYATGPTEAGNPYRQGAETTGEAGLDAKVGLATNLTMDLTVNPDFGQVEADPSEVNLTTYETFFAEKRPFFLEGKNILASGIGDDLLFYSRRIGHAPSFDPPTAGFKKVPISTRILGAAKVTGKTPEGLSVGVLQSFTDREIADITENGVARRQTVEPLTSYTVVRLQQDIDKGNTIVGGLLTATRRNLKDDALDFLSRGAYTGGLDVLHYWHDRTYYLDVRAIGSRVEGSAAAMRALMLDPVHNYQRPDATHLGVDESVTHLDGSGGLLKLGKGSNGRWRYFGSLDWRSPGLELNDAGYLLTADQIQQSARLEYVNTQPGRVLRNCDLRLDEASRYDFSGEPLQRELDFHGSVTFNGNWSLWSELKCDSELLDTRVLRGGPALLVPGRIGLSFGGQTASSKQQQFRLDLSRTASIDGHSHFTGIAPRFSARLLDIFNIEATVSYERNLEDFQYVGAAVATGANRYVLGRMDQQTLATTLRLEVNLTPELSLSYYGSPFVSTGRFSQFKLVTSPRAAHYDDRFRRLDGLAIRDPVSDTYHVSDPAAPFAFANPDFSWREWKSNLVLRWEYKTGSTAYLVWTQNRAGTEFFGDFSAGAEYRRLFSVHPDNTLLLKISYWFSI